MIAINLALKSLEKKNKAQMKPSSSNPVTSSNFKFIITNNLTNMRSIHDWKHSMLQRLIIVFLGLLTLGVFLQSCSATHASCAAYNKVEQPSTK